MKKICRARKCTYSISNNSGQNASFFTRFVALERENFRASATPRKLDQNFGTNSTFLKRSEYWEDRTKDRDKRRQRQTAFGASSFDVQKIDG
ncbi:MAG: hypothetical protein GY820_03635 [Gammaproteobacteria bacterium]|nr:hypothetical protein [Gammaproteobacteria bacterium]